MADETNNGILGQPAGADTTPPLGGLFGKIADFLGGKSGPVNSVLSAIGSILSPTTTPETIDTFAQAQPRPRAQAIAVDDGKRQVVGKHPGRIEIHMAPAANAAAVITSPEIDAVQEVKNRIGYYVSGIDPEEITVVTKGDRKFFHIVSQGTLSTEPIAHMEDRNDGTASFAHYEAMSQMERASKNGLLGNVHVSTVPMENKGEKLDQINRGALIPYEDFIENGKVKRDVNDFVNGCKRGAVRDPHNPEKFVAKHPGYQAIAPDFSGQTRTDIFQNSASQPALEQAHDQVQKGISDALGTNVKLDVTLAKDGRTEFMGHAPTREAAVQTTNALNKALEAEGYRYRVIQQGNDFGVMARDVTRYERNDNTKRDELVAHADGITRIASENPALADALKSAGKALHASGTTLTGKDYNGATVGKQENGPVAAAKDGQTIASH